MFIKHFFKSCMVIVALASTLQLRADWNQDFDRQSGHLKKSVAQFQSSEYVHESDFFGKKRNSLLKNREVKKKIEKVEAGKKSLFFEKQEKLVIKKRRNNHIHDLYAWEISYLFGLPEFVVPSFPMEIANKRVIVQKIEPFEYGTTLSQKTLDKVSVETFWKAHLLAYLLGLSDLAAGNIGVNRDGKIRFFDNEASFIYYNVPAKTELSFTTGFICQSFDWPQYRMALDKKTAKVLREYIQSLAHVEDDLKAYALCREFSILGEGFLFRLDKVRSFSLHEGKTFRDFFGFIYPHMSRGLDELNRIVGEILQRPVDHGTALFFMCRHILKYNLSNEQKSAIKLWVDAYICQP